MIQRPYLQLALALCLTTFAAGCAPETDEDAAPGDVASAEHEVVSAKEPAIEVSATWRMVVTGTPTYGFDATEPMIDVRVLVDDAALRERAPGFDGLERPFTLLPRKDAAGNVRWERLELARHDETRRGYFAERRIDVYEFSRVRLSTGDLEAVRALGVAVGLDTNQGTIWAQEPGSNFVVAQATR